jgi:hypothetical protein
MAADCNTAHYLVMANIKESLAVNEQRSQILHEIFHLKKLNEVEGKAMYFVEV